MSRDIAPKDNIIEEKISYRIALLGGLLFRGGFILKFFPNIIFEGKIKRQQVSTVNEILLCE